MVESQKKIMGNAVWQGPGIGSGGANTGGKMHIDIDAGSGVCIYMLLYTSICLHIDVYTLQIILQGFINIDAFVAYRFICFHLYLYAFIYMYIPTFVA